MRSESEIQQLIQMEAMKYDCTLMRNNSGSFKDSTGRAVRFGLGNVSKKHSLKSKSSDLIGITRVVVTSDMVGKTIGVFTAIECKGEGWNLTKKLDQHEIAQLNFLKWVVLNGGVASFASHPDQLSRVFK